MGKNEGIALLILSFWAPVIVIAVVAYWQSVLEEIADWRIEQHARRIAASNTRNNKKR